jgi:adenylate cyclase
LSAALGALTSIPYEPGRVAFWALTSGFCGLTLSAAETVLQGPAAATMRRLPVAAVFALRMLLYGSVLLIAIAAAGALLRSLSLPLPRGVDEVSLQTVLVGAGIALVVNVGFTLRALLGAGTLSSLLTGRYHWPRREERIVLFLDVVGSTQLAERLGDVEFLRFLNFVFFDLTDPVLETGGEIYRYVGDEMIISWPLQRGVRDAACIVCLFEMHETLTRRSPDYVDRFGAAPRLRAALHAGPLIVGEMGDVKREIVLLGDTMNTTARIEEVCRTTGHDYICSGAVMHALTSLPPGVHVEDLGVIQLRGKAGNLELFALQGADSSIAEEVMPPPSTSRMATVQRPAGSLAANGNGHTAEAPRTTILPE